MSVDEGKRHGKTILGWRLTDSTEAVLAISLACVFRDIDGS